MGGEEDLGSGPVDVGVLEHGHQGCRQNWVQAGVEFVDDEKRAPRQDVDGGGSGGEPCDRAIALGAEAELEFLEFWRKYFRL